MWSNVEQAADDPILGLNTKFNADTDQRKVNLGVGAYRDEQGKPVILKCVHLVEEELLKKKANHEYIPMGGFPEFVSAARSLILGKDGEIVTHANVASVQALSGTGALRLAGDFIVRFKGTLTPIYVPDPTWGNHFNIFRDSGFRNVRTYRYYDKKTNGLDLTGLLEDMNKAPKGSVFMLHACAHNPTGLDPTKEQWEIISKEIMKLGHITLFDCAYQGFASGDLEKDVDSIKYFIKQGHKVMVCQSFAKNLGLYGERVGTLSVVCDTPVEAKAVHSQLCQIIRPMFSSPPCYGARIAHGVISNPEMFELWKQEMKEMSGRINEMRALLKEKLAEVGSKREWTHIITQIGMFSYTGLNPSQCKAMIEKHHIYLTSDGRISMAGLNKNNVDYVAKAIHDCCENY